MIDILDVWNIGHALVGLSMGGLQLKRWFSYSFKVFWEIYQLIVYYPPQDLGLEDVLINSILDMLVFAIVYEVTFYFSSRVAKKEWVQRISPRTKGVIAFLLVLYGGSFVMGYDLEPSMAPSLLQISTVVFPLVLCPAIAAFVVRGLVTKEGFTDTFFVLNFKRKWPYFIGATLIPVVIASVSNVCFSLPNYVLPEWLQLTAQGIILDSWASLLGSQLVFIFQLVILVILMTPILFGQEFGWREYLQPRLIKNNPLLSAIATGLIWGLWLSSVTWRAYRLSVSEFLYLLMIIPVACICLSIILGWFRSRTGSIWATSLLHSAISVMGGSLIIAPVYVKADVVFISSLGICSLIPLGSISILILTTNWRKMA